MKFFTRELCESAYLDDQWDRVRAAYESYQARLEDLKPLLGPEVFAIADAFYVDDALIAKVRQSDECDRMQLVLRCGNLRVGYFDLDLTYHGLDITDGHLKALANVAANARGCRRFGMMDAWCHEFDVLSDGRLEHRLIFHGPEVIDIRCRSLSVVCADRPNRQLPPYPQRSRIARLAAKN